MAALFPRGLPPKAVTNTPTVAAAYDAASAERLTEFTNLHTILASDDLFMGFRDGGGNLCSYSTFLQWIFMQPECGGVAGWTFASAPNPPTRGQVAAASGTPLPRSMCSKKAAMDVAERVIKKHLTDLAVYIVDDAAGTPDPVKTAAKQASFLAVLAHPTKWHDDFNKEFPMRTSKTADSSYDKWFAALLGYAHGDFRGRLPVGGIFNANNDKQCTGALGQTKQQFLHTPCYLCGLSMDDINNMDCEHILPFTTGLRVLWLSKTGGDPLIPNILKSEYLWSHSCCNLKKSNYEFFKFDETTNGFVILNPNTPNDNSAYLMYKAMVDNKCPDEDIPGGRQLNMTGYMTQYSTHVRPMISALVDGINLEIEERFGGWGYMYVVYTILKIFSCITKYNISRLYGDPGQDGAAHAIRIRLRELKTNVKTAYDKLNEANEKLKTTRATLDKAYAVKTSDIGKAFRGFFNDCIRVLAKIRKATEGKSKSVRPRSLADDAEEQRAIVLRDAEEVKYINYLRTYPVFRASEIDVTNAQAALSAAIDELEREFPGDGATYRAIYSSAVGAPGGVAAADSDDDTGGGKLIKKSKILKGGTKEKWEGRAHEEKENLLSDRPITEEQDHFLRKYNIGIDAIRIEFGIDITKESKKTDNIHEQLAGAFQELNRTFLQMLYREATFAEINPIIRSILVIKLLIDMPYGDMDITRGHFPELTTILDSITETNILKDTELMRTLSLFEFHLIFNLLQRLPISMYSKQRYFVYLILTIDCPGDLLFPAFNMIFGEKGEGFVLQPQSYKLYFLLTPLEAEIRERNINLTTFYAEMKALISISKEPVDLLTAYIESIPEEQRQITMARAQPIFARRADLIANMFVAPRREDIGWEITGINSTRQIKKRIAGIGNIHDMYIVDEAHRDLEDRSIQPDDPNYLQSFSDKMSKLEKERFGELKVHELNELGEDAVINPRPTPEKYYPRELVARLGEAFGGPGAARGPSAAADSVSEYRGPKSAFRGQRAAEDRGQRASEDIGQQHYRNFLGEVSAAKQQKEQKEQEELKKELEKDAQERLRFIAKQSEQREKREKFLAEKEAAFQARQSERATREAARQEPYKEYHVPYSSTARNSQPSVPEQAVSQKEVEGYLELPPEERSDELFNEGVRNFTGYELNTPETKSEKRSGDDYTRASKKRVDPDIPTIRRLPTNSGEVFASISPPVRPQFRRQNSGEVFASISPPPVRPQFRRQNSGEVLASIQQPDRPTFRRQNSGELLASISPPDDSIIVKEEVNEAVREGRKRQETDYSRSQVGITGFSRTRGGKLINKTKKNKQIRQIRKTKHRQIRKTKHRQIRKTKHKNIYS
jgi:hypothetical protein